MEKEKGVMVIMLVYLGILTVSFVFYSVTANFQPQGRYLYPAISVIAVLFTLGIYTLFKDKELFLKVYLGIFILVNIASIISWWRYYN